MRIKSFIPIIIACMAILAVVTSCKPEATDADNDITDSPETDSRFIVDSVRVDGVVQASKAYTSSNKYFALQASRSDIDRVKSMQGAATLFFVVENTRAGKPRATILKAYVLDSAMNFLKDASGILVTLTLNPLKKPYPEVFTNNKSAEIGNLYLTLKYFEDLASRNSSYSGVIFRPVLNSPLSYAIDVQGDSELTSDCMLHPCPPAKPGTATCEQ